VFLGSLASLHPMDSEEFTVVFLGGFEDTRPGGAPSAEGRYERAVLAAQHQDIGVRVVQVVLELGEQELSLADLFGDYALYTSGWISARSLYSGRSEERGHEANAPSLGG
jgi:hypothetical protein